MRNASSWARRAASADNRSTSTSCWCASPARASASHASRAATRSCLGAAARRSRCWPRTASPTRGSRESPPRAAPQRLASCHPTPHTVAPELTAALGAAAAADLPLTHRRLANSVTFLNGHASDSALPDWRFFANPRHTVVVYMGVAQLPGIIASLRAAGAAPGHPVAIIERATLPEQRILGGN